MPERWFEAFSCSSHETSNVAFEEGETYFVWVEGVVVVDGVEELVESCRVFTIRDGSVAMLYGTGD